MLNNLHELRAFIQKNCPMFLTNDLTLYAIIGKVVWYTNELIERSNRLNELLKKLEDLTEEELKTLQNEVDNFILNNNRLFEEFKTEINTDLSNFKKEITDNYNTFTQEQLNRLDDIIARLIEEFDSFKKSITDSYNDYIKLIKDQLDTYIDNKTNEIDTWKQGIEEQYTTDKETLTNDFNSKYSELETELNRQLNEFMTNKNAEYDSFKEEVNTSITNKETEVDEKIAEIQDGIPTAINDYISNTYVKSKEFTNILKNAFPQIINLAYMGTKDTFPSITENDNWLYATDENKLYKVVSNEITLTNLDSYGYLLYYEGVLYIQELGKIYPVGSGALNE